MKKGNTIFDGFKKAWGYGLNLFQQFSPKVQGITTFGTMVLVISLIAITFGGATTQIENDSDVGRSVAEPDSVLLDQLFADTLALERVQVLMSALDGILATSPEGIARDMKIFSPDHKANIVAIIALAGDCSYDYWDDDPNDPVASIYHAVAGDFPVWWDAWDADVERILDDSLGMFGEAAEHGLTTRVVEKLKLKEYFTPKVEKSEKRKSEIVSLEKSVKPLAKDKKVITKPVTKPKAKKAKEKKAAKQKPVAPKRKEVKKGRVSKSQKTGAAYFAEIAPVVKKALKGTGIPPSLCLSQEVNEAGWPEKNSELRKYHNHYATKWKAFLHGKFKQVKIHDDCCTNGKCKKPDRFVAFPDAETCYKEHVEFLNQPRYAPLFKKKPTGWKDLKEKGSNSDDEAMWKKAVANWNVPYLRWSYGLDALGYATKKGYAKQLIGTSERYRLNQYDK